MSAVPITAESVINYLTERGVESGANCQVTTMTGGVSGRVLLVESDRIRIVVKQALEQLLVSDTWMAKPERALTEAAALDVLHSLSGGYVPELIDSDSEKCALVMTAAPADWQPWKTGLLDTDIDHDATCATGRTLGSVLGAWHRATSGDFATAQRFSDYEAFEQLRVQPFHRTIRARHRELADVIETCIADLTERRECLVHGDFSPKNVLVDPNDPERLWVLDLEVAHYGAAVFDVAFLQCHLLLKALHRPLIATTLSKTASAFLTAYTAEVGSPAADRATRLLGWHTGCLLLARVDGTSPADYLTDSVRDRVRDLASAVLSTPDRPIGDVWALAKEMSHPNPDQD